MSYEVIVTTNEGEHYCRITLPRMPVADAKLRHEQLVEMFSKWLLNVGPLHRRTWFGRHGGTPVE